MLPHQQAAEIKYSIIRSFKTTFSFREREVNKVNVEF
jgi:hypothetical protein